MFMGDSGLEKLWVEMQMIFNIYIFPNNQVTTLPGAGVTSSSRMIM